MATNGIHLVLGISGICLFLVASETSPTPPPKPRSSILVCRVLQAFIVFSHLFCNFFFVFDLHVFCACRKKSNILCTLCVHVRVCVVAYRCIVNRVLQDYAYAMCALTMLYTLTQQHFVLRCVLCFVLTNYANEMQTDVSRIYTAASKRLQPIVRIVVLVSLNAAPYSINDFHDLI